MRAGRMRHFVRLQRATQTATASGGYTETWSTYKQVWCDIIPQRGMEFDQAGQMIAKLPHTVMMRYPGEDVHPKDRILWGSRILHILSVVDVGERSRDLEIMALEKDI